jgi:2,4-diketo-3-deoxy-L-fuconate hydrolase
MVSAGRRISGTMRENRCVDSAHATFIVRFDPHFIAHYLSQFPVLEPGDLNNTRAQPGAGMSFTLPVWPQPGDIMELGIQDLGAQQQKVLEPR